MKRYFDQLSDWLIGRLQQEWTEKTAEREREKNLMLALDGCSGSCVVATYLFKTQPTQYKWNVFLHLSGCTNVHLDFKLAPWGISTWFTSVFDTWIYTIYIIDTNIPHWTNPKNKVRFLRYLIYFFFLVEWRIVGGLSSVFSSSLVLFIFFFSSSSSLLLLLLLTLGYYMWGVTPSWTLSFWIERQQCWTDFCSSVECCVVVVFIDHMVGSIFLEYFIS